MTAEVPNSSQPPSPVAPTSDVYLEAVTIGGREPLNGPIELAEYNPQWQQLFTWAAVRVREALGDKVRTLEHVGSTAVPELCAKPLIDMVLSVDDSADEDSYLPPLEAVGFVLRIREPDWFQHRFFLLTAGTQVWQLHVFSAGCEEIERMVVFRDWLRTHERDRCLYETTKVALAKQQWKHVQNYADAKSDVVGEILARAMKATRRRP